MLSKNMNIRGSNELRTGLQPISNLVKVENAFCLWIPYFRIDGTILSTMNEYGVCDVMQTEEQVAEPLVPQPSPLEDEIVIVRNIYFFFNLPNTFSLTITLGFTQPLTK
jgi:hypothetical protein